MKSKNRDFLESFFICFLGLTVVVAFISLILTLIFWYF